MLIILRGENKSGFWSALRRIALIGLLANGSVLAQDPDLKPGFPVQTYHGGGTYAAGPGLHVLVGNIDDDPELEIIVTGLARGPLYAWNHDGSSVVGWPLADSFGAGYPALGNLSETWPGCQIFSAYFGRWLSAYSGSGQALSGWPREALNFLGRPAALADVNGDGIDEIFIGGNDGYLHGMRADGTSLPGWPVEGSGIGADRVTPAVADLDGDGIPEIVTVSGGGAGGEQVLAYHVDGRLVDGFPARVSGGGPYKWLAIGDVDGDASPEIVVVTGGVYIFAADGTLKRLIRINERFPVGTAPALADLNGDGRPEIIVQTNEALYAWYGNGNPVGSFPQRFLGGLYQSTNSAPVVGDIDGDGEPEIVVVLKELGSQWGRVWGYWRNGGLHPRLFKRLLLGHGGVPAIADLDGDGRNEIIVIGDYWDGRAGYYDKVWVYDLGGPRHGPIEWGQLGNGPRHQNRYLRPSARIGIEQCKINAGPSGWR